MKQLSVCMPSNRGFERSFSSIETALAFCEARDAVLIVSDNSGDAKKAAYWQGRSAHLVYLPDAPVDPIANARNTFLPVETPFLMPMGDDDELFAQDVCPAIDLAALAPDVIGVKPCVELFLDGTDLSVPRVYALDADTPGQRLRQYIDRNEGDNSTFYSIFRTEPYLSLREYFLASHPTRGSYADWQMVMALIVAGRMLLDRSMLFRYNVAAWATPEAVDTNAKHLYTSVGLPENFRDYNSLLRWMDLFVFASRKGVVPNREALAEVQAGELSDLLDLGLRIAVERAAELHPALAELARKGLQERNPMLKFLHGAAVLDCFQPGLKAKYIAFLKSASV
ncbi:hypothetical protein [Rhizobium sp. C4]|uniref:hypothetical protein n=1 Tax=Rhizobium sp. C4 TaxID=1349800 RepID=UPI001E3E0930|nr:hypothetical protein [Rhizobium sp. C4]MCD2173295.1 hypothetical protein [Rhizobium sp. C4]